VSHSLHCQLTIKFRQYASTESDDIDHMIGSDDEDEESSGQRSPGMGAASNSR
jgi:hypothetical protein